MKPDDLVGRLRTESAGWKDNYPFTGLLLEAADEIEKLRAALECCTDHDRRCDATTPQMGDNGIDSRCTCHAQHARRALHNA